MKSFIKAITTKFLNFVKSKRIIGTIILLAGIVLYNYLASVPLVVQFTTLHILAITFAGLLLPRKTFLLGMLLIPVSVMFSQVHHFAGDGFAPITLLLLVIYGLYYSFPAIVVSLFFKKHWIIGAIVLLVACVPIIDGLPLIKQFVIHRAAFFVLAIGGILFSMGREKLPHSDEKNIAFEEKTKVKDKKGNEQELKTLYQEAEYKLRFPQSQEDILRGLLLKHYIFLEYKNDQAVRNARALANNEIARIDKFTSNLLNGDIHYENALHQVLNNIDSKTDIESALGYYHLAEEDKRVCAWLWAKISRLFMLTKSVETWKVVETAMQNAWDVNADDPEVIQVSEQYRWRKQQETGLSVGSDWEIKIASRFHFFEKSLKNKKK